MATGAVATAAGAAMILYFLFSRRMSLKEREGDDRSGEFAKSSRSVRRRISRRPAQAPATWIEAMSTLSETLRFTYSETLGKWPIGDLAFGINYLMRRQLLKPAFTIICDSSSKCFLLLIRGTHSIKDTLTAATGAVVPFHHSVLHEGGVSNLILGYAHCGMVAAARWIAKCSTPCLLKALKDFPDHKIKIVGHSLGGGTAALLTYILRERKEFSSSTCVTFAPAACMTWELAESGKHFITTIINGSDLVPTFSIASIDDLRSEVVMKRAQNVAQAVVKTRSTLSSWTCMGARRRTVGPPPAPQEEKDDSNASLLSKSTSDSLVSEEVIVAQEVDDELNYESRDRSGHDETEEEEELIQVDHVSGSAGDEMTEGELWYELEKELHRQKSETSVKAREEEEEAAAKEITEEEIVLADAAEQERPSSSSDSAETQRFYPPGRIMHIISLPPAEETNDNGDGSITNDPSEGRVGIYETQRQLYIKLRLSKTMINDHYMPMYKKMMEHLISELEKEDEESVVL
ncbi:hypothetical protein Sjap_006896 [Stephania japonica]|uniref:Sn1-specific diacylglycerol lipase alpha n=1 Tax=Stephania japonica TaxID=461633 RepID=A0AAP0PJD9_9MAGN